MLSRPFPHQFYEMLHAGGMYAVIMGFTFGAMFGLTIGLGLSAFVDWLIKRKHW